MHLVGRGKECAEIDELLATARESRSGVLLIRGDPGVGKTSLVEYAERSSPGFQGSRIVGVEMEAGFAFSGLYRLLLPFLPRIENLAPAQETALRVALSMEDGQPSDHHLVALATLNMLAENALGQPTLLLVDDAHWVDLESLRVLGFVARRLFAESVAMIFTARPDEVVESTLGAVPRIELEGLDTEASLELLSTVVKGPIDPHIANRVVVATDGNPLAISDLGRELSSHQLVGATLLPEPVPLGQHLEAHYRRQLSELPKSTQEWLLVAAAEPSGEPGYIGEAARGLRIDPTARGPAEEAGIVVVKERVQFRHSLVRSAIYNGATSVEREAAHRALASSISRSEDSDRRIWHLAAATSGSDEEVATLLETAAGQAGARGGFAARTEFLIRAAQLSPDPESRSTRLMAAAESAFAAGSLARARSLLEGVENTNSLVEGRKQILGAVVDLVTGVPGAFSRASEVCLSAAMSFGPDHPEELRNALFQACRHSVPAEYLMGGITYTDIGEALERHGVTEDDSSLGLLFRAFSKLALDGYEASVPHIRAAVKALLADGDEEFRERYILGVTLSMMTWDIESHMAIIRRAADIARRAGAIQELDVALYCLTTAETLLGDLVEADSHVMESHVIRATLGATPDMWEAYRYPELMAWRGEQEHTRATLQSTRDASEIMGLGATVSMALIGTITLDLGQGRYAEAYGLARELTDGDSLGVHTRVLPDLIEAAARSGEPEAAGRALETLRSRAKASGTPWADGLLLRSEALCAQPEDTESLYEAAIERLADTPARTDLARTHLLFGEWLRREKRRREARGQLRNALEMFEDMGAADFAERTRKELAATGETARKRTVESLRDLTVQEEQIARLAAQGDTNKEIGERLFISPRTVDYHLRKVYQKLEVGSRRDLRNIY